MGAQCSPYDAARIPQEVWHNFLLQNTLLLRNALLTMRHGCRKRCGTIFYCRALCYCAMLSLRCGTDTARGVAQFSTAEHSALAQCCKNLGSSPISAQKGAEQCP